MIMRMTLKTGFGLAVLVVAFGASVFLMGSMLSARAQTSIEVPATLGAEAIQFASESGAEIHGSWVEGRPDMPVILLMHGVRANRTALFARAELLKWEGYSVLMFDFQAHGESQGSHITFGFLESRDARAALKYIISHRPGSKIGAIAISMGGAAALLGEAPIAVDALILESVYPDIRTATDNRIRRWLGPIASLLTPLFIVQLEQRLGIAESALSPLSAIANLQCPVLIISGELDKHTTLADTRLLFSRAPEPKELVVVPQARHVDLLAHNPQIYRENILKFLRKYLE